MENTSPSTAPFRVGTANVQLEGNENIHYYFGIVDLYASAQVSDNYQIKQDSGGNYLKYTYSYSETPNEGDSIKSFLLNPMYPKLDEDGNLIQPYKIVVVNENDSEEKKSGEVSTVPTVKLPAFKPNAMLDTKVVPDPYVPRCQVFKSAVDQPDSTTTDYYFIFIVAKTPGTNTRKLTTVVSSKLIACSANNDGEPEVNLASIAIVEASSVESGTKVTLNKNTTDLETTTKSFDFNPVSNGNS